MDGNSPWDNSLASTIDLFILGTWPRFSGVGLDSEAPSRRRGVPVRATGLLQQNRESAVRCGDQDGSRRRHDSVHSDAGHGKRSRSPRIAVEGFEVDDHKKRSPRIVVAVSGRQLFRPEGPHQYQKVNRPASRQKHARSTVQCFHCSPCGVLRVSNRFQLSLVCRGLRFLPRGTVPASRSRMLHFPYVASHPYVGFGGCPYIRGVAQFPDVVSVLPWWRFQSVLWGFQSVLWSQCCYGGDCSLSCGLL